MSQLLTDDDLVELTACKQKNEQIKWLQLQGINFYVRKDGRASCTWHMINNPFIQKVVANQEPNFEAM